MRNNYFQRKITRKIAFDIILNCKTTCKLWLTIRELDYYIGFCILSIGITILVTVNAEYPASHRCSWKQEKRSL